MLNVHVDPTAAQPRSSKQTKTSWQTWRYNAKISQHWHSVCPFAGLDDDLDYQSVCVSVTLCLGKIPLANTPTQTAHTLGLTAMGIGEATRLGEKR